MICENGGIPLNFGKLREEVLSYMEKYLLKFQTCIETAESYLIHTKDPLTENDKKEMWEVLKDAKKLFASLYEQSNRSTDAKSVHELKSNYYHFRHDIRSRYKELGLEFKLS